MDATSKEGLTALTAPVAALVAARAPEIDIGRALIDLRGRVDGRWKSALRLIWPCIANPGARAHEAMDAARAAAKAGLAARDLTTERTESTETNPLRTVQSLTEQEQRRYGLVAPLLGMRGSDRREAVNQIAAAEQVNAGTVYVWLKRARDGAAGLKRKRRTDAGKSALPEGARQMLLARRLNPRTRDENLALSLRLVRDQFPGASEAALRHVARSIPAAARLSREEYAKRFLPTGEWVAPYPNHSWSFDYTIGDVKCWDGDPRVKPYRPWVTAMIDEATGAPTAILYTREHPDRYALRSVLLMGILPKRIAASDETAPQREWPQHGLPERLHGDNGKIQRSLWLADVCRQIGIGLDVQMDLAFSNAYESWQNGHIESFWCHLHQMFEARFGEIGAYCGRDPEARKRNDGYIGDSGRLSDWKKLPTCADMNRGAQEWICAELLTRMHSRLGMSRNDAWRATAEGHVKVPDEPWLRQILMFKERRLVRRARVALNGFAYWSERLIDYEGIEVPVWWDAAHLETVLVLNPEGKEICWAEVERPHELGDQESLADYRRKRAAATQRRREFAAMADDAGEFLPAAKVEDVIARLRAGAVVTGRSARAPVAEPAPPAAITVWPRPMVERAADEGLEYLARRARELTTEGTESTETDPLLLLARGAAAQAGVPVLHSGLTFHGIDIGAGQHQSPPASDPSADQAGPDDSCGDSQAGVPLDAARGGPVVQDSHGDSQAGVPFDAAQGGPVVQDDPGLPESFGRWVRDRYGKYGDAPRQPAQMRKAAREQLEANYASAGARPAATGRKRP